MQDKKANKQQVSITQINAVLDKFRPYFSKDAGGFEVIRITDEGVVRIELKGACRNCDVDKRPIKEAMQKALKEEFPQVREVVLL